MKCPTNIYQILPGSACVATVGYYVCAAIDNTSVSYTVALDYNKNGRFLLQHYKSSLVSLRK